MENAKHFIVAIGYTGEHDCYLDVPKEEAQRRFKEASDGSFTDDDIEDMTTIMYFNEHFLAYQLWKPDIKDGYKKGAWDG